MNVGEIWIAINGNLKGLANDLSKGHRMLNQFKEKMDSTFSGSKAIVAGTTAIGGAMAGAGVAALKLAADYERTETAFTSLLKSGDEAKKFLNELESFADASPFESDQLQKSAQMLLSTKKILVSEVIPAMTALGDAASDVGRGPEEVENVVRQISQMIGKGKIQMEELNILAENGFVDAKEAMADSFGMSVEQFTKAAEKGSIPAITAIKGMFQNLEKWHAGAMEKQSRTLWGKYSTIMEKLKKAGRIAGDSLVKSFDIKAIMDKAINALTTFTGILQKKGLKGGLAELFPSNARKNIALIAGAIMGMMIPAVVSLGLSIASTMIPLIPFALAGMLIVKNWKRIKPLFERLSPVVNTVRRAFSFMLGETRSGAISTANGVKDSTKTIQENIDKLHGKKVTIEVSTGNGSKVKSPLEDMKSWLDEAKKFAFQFTAPFKGIGNNISESIGAVNSLFKDVFNAETKDAVGKAGKSFVAVLLGSISGIAAGILRTVPGIIKALGGITAGFASFFKGLISFIKGDGEGVKTAFADMTRSWHTVTDGVVDIFKGIFGGLVDGGKAAMRAIGYDIDSSLDYMIDAIKDKVSVMGKLFTDPVETMKKIGKGTAFAKDKLQLFVKSQGYDAGTATKKVKGVLDAKKVKSGAQDDVMKASGEALYNLRAAWERSGIPKTVAAQDKAILDELQKLTHSADKETLRTVASVLRGYLFMKNEAVDNSIVPDMARDIMKVMSKLSTDMGKVSKDGSVGVLDNLFYMYDEAVAHSIVPDMADAIGKVMVGMKDDSITTTAKMTKGTLSEMNNMARGEGKKSRNMRDDLFYTFRNMTSNVTALFRGMADGVNGATASITTSPLQESITQLSSIWGTNCATVSTTTQSMGSAIASSFTTAILTGVNPLEAAFNAAIPQIGSLITALLPSPQLLAKSIVTGFRSANEAGINPFSNAWSAFKALVSGDSVALAGSLDALSKSTTLSFNNAQATALNPFQAGWIILSQFVTGEAERMKAAVAGFVKGLGDGFLASIGSTGQMIQAISNVRAETAKLESEGKTHTEAFNIAWSKSKDSIQAAAEGIANELVTFMNNMTAGKQNAASLTGVMENLTKNGFTKQSEALRQLTGSQQALSSGLAQATTAMKQSVKGWLKDFLEAAQKQIAAYYAMAAARDLAMGNIFGAAGDVAAGIAAVAAIQVLKNGVDGLWSSELNAAAQTQAINQAYADLSTALSEANKKEQALGAGFSKTTSDMMAYEKAINDLISAGVSADDNRVRELSNVYKAMQVGQNILQNLEDQMSANSLKNGVNGFNAAAANVAALQDAYVQLRKMNVARDNPVLTNIANQISGMGGQVPALAKGGIVSNPTMALIGEAGSEAVVPLTAFSQAVAALNGVRDTLVNAVKALAPPSIPQSGMYGGMAAGVAAGNTVYITIENPTIMRDSDVDYLMNRVMSSAKRKGLTLG